MHLCKPLNARNGSEVAANAFMKGDKIWLRSIMSWSNGEGNLSICYTQSNGRFKNT